MKPECKKYYKEDGSVGREYWYLNNKYHRTDGPAIIYYNGNDNIETECWYLNGKRHRTDGPAIILYRESGSVEREIWSLNDKYIDPKGYLISIPKTEEEKIGLINKFVFIKKNNDYTFIKGWLKRDKEFYEKYRMLVE